MTCRSCDDITRKQGRKTDVSSHHWNHFFEFECAITESDNLCFDLTDGDGMPWTILIPPLLRFYIENNSHIGSSWDWKGIYRISRLLPMGDHFSRDYKLQYRTLWRHVTRPNELFLHYVMSCKAVPFLTCPNTNNEMFKESVDRIWENGY